MNFEKSTFWHIYPLSALGTKCWGFFFRTVGSYIPTAKPRWWQCFRWYILVGYLFDWICVDIWIFSHVRFLVLSLCFFGSDQTLGSNPEIPNEIRRMASRNPTVPQIVNRYFPSGMMSWDRSRHSLRFGRLAVPPSSTNYAVARQDITKIDTVNSTYTLMKFWNVIHINWWVGVTSHQQHLIFAKI